MRVSKYHGIGNDFVLIEDMEERVVVTAPLATALCDRHLGVGADGVIRIAPGTRARFRMEYRNADGSTEAMCGNGIRCLATYVYEHGLTDRTELDVETPAGVKQLELEVVGGRVLSVRVDMGRPRLERGDIPMRGPSEGWFIGQPLAVDGTVFRATAVSMGNPHLVLIGQADLARLDVSRIGPLLEHHGDFPLRTNVEFVRVAHGTVHARVWERGSGETRGCGTGACAALVAAHLEGLVARRAPVRFPGGELDVEWTADGRIILAGPTRFVFDAEVDEAVLPALGEHRLDIPVPLRVDLDEETAVALPGG